MGEKKCESGNFGRRFWNQDQRGKSSEAETNDCNRGKTDSVAHYEIKFFLRI